MLSQEEADLQQAILASLQEFEVPDPLKNDYKPNLSLTSDGRCFSASAFFVLNDYNTYNSNQELNEWIQQHIIDPILNLPYNNWYIVMWVYNFIMLSEEMQLKSDQDRIEIQTKLRSVYGADFLEHILTQDKINEITTNPFYQPELYGTYIQYIQSLNRPIYTGNDVLPTYSYTEPQFGPGYILAFDPAYNKNIQIVTRHGIQNLPGLFYGIAKDPTRETVYIFYNGVNHYVPLQPKNMLAYREMKSNRPPEVFIIPPSPPPSVPSINQPSTVFEQPKPTSQPTTVLESLKPLSPPSVLQQPTINTVPIEIIEEIDTTVPNVDMKKICKRYKRMQQSSKVYGGRTCKKRKGTKKTKKKLSVHSRRRNKKTQHFLKKKRKHNKTHKKYKS